MRTIKFRAWDKEHEVMRDWDSLLFPESKYFGFQWLLTNLPQDHKHEFMQFTGLLDKTRKEIYEGDIVQPAVMGDGNIDWYHTDQRGQVQPMPREIKWNQRRCGFDAPQETEYWEVIGNIYENPKLITSLSEPM